MEIERSQVRMPAGPLKQVGEFPLQIALHTDVVVTITVAVNVSTRQLRRTDFVSRVREALKDTGLESRFF